MDNRSEKKRLDDVEGLVLAGGQATRFGSDKALFVVRGVTLAEHVYQTLASVIRPVRVCLAARDQRNPIEGAEVVVDDPRGTGPIGGLHAGLLRMDTNWLFVAACDMPGLAREHVAGLLENRRDGPVVAVGADGRRHPLLGCYPRSVLPMVEACLREGRFSMQALLDRTGATAVNLPGTALQNVNSREDLLP